ncbi:MAG: nucleoside phosphorylase [Acutalibacteraceae bacterium]|jgi:uridine phosphorylase
MITDAYDIHSAPLITPRDCYGEQGRFCDVCVVTFSGEILAHALAAHPHETIAAIHTANGSQPIYALEIDGKKIGLYLSAIGSAMAANNVIEANWLTGATRFVMFGSAGSLDHKATAGKYVVPTFAWRDEGMSYHYAPASDAIPVPGWKTVAGLFEAWGVPFVKGGVWTTDAFFRETRGHLQRRRDAGCLAVEMELAGVQAVCDFHGWRLYDFLVTGDVLDLPEYDHSGLHAANHATDKWDLAVKIALQTEIA